jgi:hypothetical protein
MVDEFLDLQRLPLGRVTHQGDRFLRTVRDAHPAAHTNGGIDAGEAVIYRDRRKQAMVGAGSADGAQPGVHLGHKARGGQHRRTVLVGPHRPAAAGTAVADGIEPAKHGIFVQVDTIEHVPSL